MSLPRFAFAGVLFIVSLIGLTSCVSNNYKIVETSWTLLPFDRIGTSTLQVGDLMRSTSFYEKTDFSVASPEFSTLPTSPATDGNLTDGTVFSTSNYGLLGSLTAHTSGDSLGSITVASNNVFELILKNQHVYSLDSHSIRENYLPRFKYWGHGKGKIIDKYVITQVLVCDKVNIHLVGTNTAAMSTDVKDYFAKLHIGANGELSNTAERTTSGRVVVAVMLVPVSKIIDRESDINPYFIERLNPPEFKSEEKLALQPSQLPPHELGEHNEFHGKAIVRVDGLNIFMHISGYIHGELLPPRGSYGLEQDFTITPHSYHRGTRLTLQPAAILQNNYDTGLIPTSGDKWMGPFTATGNLPGRYTFFRYGPAKLSWEFGPVLMRVDTATAN